MTIELDANLRHEDGSFILFQEQVADQKEALCGGADDFTWAIACGSVVLQRTRREQAFPCIEQLLNEWSPLRCTNDQPWSFRQLVQLLKPSGLPEIKALRIANFSRQFLAGEPPDHWVKLKGYTRDSVLIFTDGLYLTYYTERLPSDPHLANYVLRWRSLKSVREAIEDSSSGKILDDYALSEPTDRSSFPDLRISEPTDLAIDIEKGIF